MDVIRWDLLLPDFLVMSALVVERHDYFLSAWGDTLRISLYASLLAVLASLLLGILAYRYTIFETFFSPLVVTSQSFPLQAIAPLIVIALGHGDLSKITIAFLIAFFPLFSVTLGALKATPSPLVALCRVTNAPFIKAIVLVYFPAALPAMLTGAKVAFTLAVLGTVVAEFISPTAGIGRLLLRAQSDYSVNEIYVCILMLVAQGLAFFLVITWVESRINLRWR